MPGALAQLQSGWGIWLQFAREAGALGPAEQVELRAALTGGRAHVADRQGRTPESPEIWGCGHRWVLLSPAIEKAISRQL